MYFRAFFRCRAIRSQNVWKVIAYWLMKWGLLFFRQQSSYLQIVPQRGFKYARFLAVNTKRSSLFRRYPRRFGRTGCNDLRDGAGKQRKFERRIRKRNHAFGNESIRVRPPFIISSCTLYISWLFRMSAKYVRNLGRTNYQPFIYKAPKRTL